jgi:hypothetical protein
MWINWFSGLGGGYFKGYGWMLDLDFLVFRDLDQLVFADLDAGLVSGIMDQDWIGFGFFL